MNLARICFPGLALWNPQTQKKYANLFFTVKTKNFGGKKFRKISKNSGNDKYIAKFFDCEIFCLDGTAGKCEMKCRRIFGFLGCHLQVIARFLAHWKRAVELYKVVFMHFFLILAQNCFFFTSRQERQ